MRFVIKLVATALGLWVATLLPLHVEVVGGSEGWHRVLVFGAIALVLVALNEILKPIIKVLSIPLLILTLGLFNLIITWFILWLAHWITGFMPWQLELGGFWPSLGAALVVAIVASVAEALLAKITRTKRR